MTINEIRQALEHMENNFGFAIDAEDYSLAAAFKAKIDYLWDELIRKIQEDDPYTTEADIRYFEGEGA